MSAPGAGGGIGEELTKKLARSLNPEAWSLWENHGLEKDCVDDTLADLKSLFSELTAAGYAVVRREPTHETWRAYIRARGYDPDEPADTLDKALLGVGAKEVWQAMLKASEEEQR